MTTLSRAILVGLDTGQQGLLWSAQSSMDELEELAKTAGVVAISKILQHRDKPHYSHYVGKGKLDEIGAMIKQKDIHILITDDELTPAQHKTLEKILNIKILDRTNLILDIFAQRAHTFEAQLQVELAQLDYMMPRLTRLWTHLSRLGGGIGTRGPGEKQLEVDKRQIRKRIETIKKKLLKVQRHRHLQRQKRHALPVLTGAIVGYTNAGKSLLMNRLTKASILSENKLFATLDPTTRQYCLPNNEHIVLTDTVGFIQKLPHHLIKAFYATLEEVTDADFLLHVIDASHPDIEARMETSLTLIESLNSHNKPHLFIFNKIDQVHKLNELKNKSKLFKPKVLISALKDKDLSSLIKAVEELLSRYQKRMTFRLNYTRMDILNLLHDHGTIVKTVYNDMIEVEVDINQIKGEKIMGMLSSKRA